MESDPFVPFTYSEPDSALRLEVQANDFLMAEKLLEVCDRLRRKGGSQ